MQCQSMEALAGKGAEELLEDVPTRVESTLECVSGSCAAIPGHCTLISLAEAP